MPNLGHHSPHGSAPHPDFPAPPTLWLKHSSHGDSAGGSSKVSMRVSLCKVSFACSCLQTATQLVCGCQHPNLSPLCQRWPSFAEGRRHFLPCGTLFVCDDFPLGRFSSDFLPHQTFFPQRQSGTVQPVAMLRFIPLLRVWRLIPAVCVHLLPCRYTVDQLRGMQFHQFSPVVGIRADVVQVISQPKLYRGEQHGYASHWHPLWDVSMRVVNQHMPFIHQGVRGGRYCPSSFCITSFIPGIWAPMFTTFPR